jgi:bla regulator protein blaR1
MTASAFPVLELAWTLIHFLWQGAVIGGAYALIRPLLAAPRPRLVLGQLALLAMALAPVATFLVLLGAIEPPAASTAVPGDSGATALLALHARSAAQGPGWLVILVALWAAGALLLALRVGLRWMAIRRLCRAALPAPDPLQALSDALARRMGLLRPVALRLCRQLKTPVLVGFWRPVILVPVALAASLPVRQLELLVAHELAHVQRWDFLANLLQTALEIVLYYHPLVHWVSARVREDREHCCDDLVAERFGCPVQYARALLAVAEFGQDRLPPLALAATGGVLMPRIERLLGLAVEPRQRLRHRAAVSVLLGAALALLLASAFRTVPSPEPLAIAPLPREAGHRDLPGLRAALAAVSLLAPARRPVAPEFAPDSAEPVPVPLPVGEPAASGFFRAAAAPLALTPAAPVDMALRLAPAVLPPAAEPAGPALLRYESPVYPASAQARGVEGEVVMTFRILPDGRVTDIEPLSVEPAGEAGFVQAARQALRNWRFERVPGGVGRQQRSFQFRLADTDVTPRCLVNTGSRLCRGPD